MVEWTPQLREAVRTGTLMHYRPVVERLVDALSPDDVLDLVLGALGNRPGAATALRAKGFPIMPPEQPLYEGKAKQVFAGPDADTVVIAYKDTATAFNGEKKEDLQGKGVLNCAITALVFQYLADHGVKTHLVRKLDDTRLLVKKVEIVPLEVIIRNVAAGSFSKRYGVPEGTALKNVVLEYSYKDDSLGDPLINDSQATAMGVTDDRELAEIAAAARRINDLMIPFFAKAGLKLVDFKLEFGRFGPNRELLLADEISPDTCRFWDAKTNEKLDKDRFRRDLGNVIEAYQEVFRRVSGGE